MGLTTDPPKCAQMAKAQWGAEFPFYGDTSNVEARALIAKGTPLQIAFAGDGDWNANHPFMQHYKHGCVQPACILLGAKGEHLWSHCVTPSLSNGGGATQRATPRAAWGCVQEVLAGRPASEPRVTQTKTLNFFFGVDGRRNGAFVFGGAAATWALGWGALYGFVAGVVAAVAVGRLAGKA